MRKAHLILLLFSICALQGFANTGKKQITLRFSDTQTAIFDETSVYLDLGSPQYIFPEDGQKIFDTSSSAPSFYSIASNGIFCFSNSYGSFNKAAVIPLGFKVSTGGLFRISPQLVDNFDSTSMIRLEDRATGIFYDLRNGSFTIQLAQATEDNNRFFIHASVPVVLNSIDAGCANNDGSIAINQDTTISWTSCTLYDENFSQLQTLTNVTGTFNFNGLPYGTYNVTFKYGNYATSTQIKINGRSVTSNVSASTVYAYVGEPVHFFASAVNATNFIWDLGDGSQIVGVMNPTYTYSLTGTYNVTVRCSNSFGCSSTSTTSINVSAATGINTIDEEEASITANHKTISILLKKQTADDTRLEVYNLTGQLISSRPINAMQTNVDLSAEPAGVYVARLIAGHATLAKKLVLQ